MARISGGRLLDSDVIKRQRYPAKVVGSALDGIEDRRAALPTRKWCKGNKPGKIVTREPQFTRGEEETAQFREQRKVRESEAEKRVQARARAAYKPPAW